MTYAKAHYYGYTAEVGFNDLVTVTFPDGTRTPVAFRLERDGDVTHGNLSDTSVELPEDIRDGLADELGRAIPDFIEFREDGPLGPRLLYSECADTDRALETHASGYDASWPDEVRTSLSHFGLAVFSVPLSKRSAWLPGAIWRLAEVPRGWYEVSEDGGETWEDVPPGSTTVPDDVRERLDRERPAEVSR